MGVISNCTFINNDATGLEYLTLLNVTVLNEGDVIATSVVVRLKDNGNTIGTQIITNLAKGATTTINFDWTPTFGNTDNTQYNRNRPRKQHL